MLAPETRIFEVVSAKVVENKGYGGYQLEIQIGDPNPETGNMRIWLTIPKSGRVTSRSLLGWWITQAMEVEDRLEGLDFRNAAATAKSLTALCQILLGEWFVWENQVAPLKSTTGQPNPRWVPVSKFKTAEEAKEAWAASASEEEFVPEFADEEELPGLPGSNISEEIINTALPVYQSASEEQRPEVIATITKQMFPGIDPDELLAALAARAG